MDMYFILMVVKVLLICLCQYLQTLHYKYVQFIACQLYFNIVVKNQTTVTKKANSQGLQIVELPDR